RRCTVPKKPAARTRKVKRPGTSRASPSRHAHVDEMPGRGHNACMPSVVPIVFDILHTTEYRYARPVELGEHRLMFRPRDSHDLRVLATDLKVEPEATEIRLIQDAYENSVALVQPKGPAEKLTFTCLFTVEHTGSRALDLPLSQGAEHYPFEYAAEDRLVLQHYLTPYYDADETLMAWAREFVGTDSRQILVDMTKRIRESMS